MTGKLPGESPDPALLASPAHPRGSGVSQPAVLSTRQSCCQCWGAEDGVLGHGPPRGLTKVQTLLGVGCGWVGGQHWKVHLSFARVHLPPLSPYPSPVCVPAGSASTSSPACPHRRNEADTVGVPGLLAALGVRPPAPAPPPDSPNKALLQTPTRLLSCRGSVPIFPCPPIAPHSLPCHCPHSPVLVPCCDPPQPEVQRRSIHCPTVTENPGTKPRNTNVVLKGRHSLVQHWIHGGQFHQTWSEDHPPHLSNALKYIPKVYFVGWIFARKCTHLPKD